MDDYASTLGILIAWCFSVLLIATVGTFAFANSGPISRNDLYKQLRAPLLRASYLVTALALFYFALSLDSRAFTGRGIPFLSNTYQTPASTAGSPWSLVQVQDVILLSFVTLSISFAYGLLPRWPAFGEIIGTRMKSVVVWVFFIPLILAVSLALILGWWRGTTEELAASETPPAHACVQLPWPMCNLDALALLGIFLVVLLAVSLAGRRLVLNDHDQGDLEELSTHLGLVPALIIGPMVLASDPLLIFPNVLGLAVVGFLVVNGLLVLLLVANMVVDADSQSIGRILAIVCIACLRSLAWLTGAAAAALIVAGNTLGVVPNQLLLAPAAFLLIILPYGHLFSRIWRYEFGYWWANEKVTMMELSILALVVVGPIPYGGLKVWLAVVAVIMLLLLPMTRALRIVMLVQRFSRSFGVQARRDWGIVLIKTNPGDVAGVMKEIDDLRHVHSVTAVLGGIDLMVSVEAFSAEEFTRSVGQVRSIAGVRKVEVAVDVTRLMPGREAPF